MRLETELSAKALGSIPSTGGKTRITSQNSEFRGEKYPEGQDNEETGPKSYEKDYSKGKANLGERI